MPERDAIVESINAIIEAERGTALSEDQLLIESGLDSFAYAVFWLSLSDMGMSLRDEWIDTIDYNILTVAMIVDKIMEQSNGSH